MKGGKLNKREMATLCKALDILSDWTEHEESANNDGTYEYDNAMAAVVGLCEFVNTVNGVQLPTIEM